MGSERELSAEDARFEDTLNRISSKWRAFITVTKETSPIASHYEEARQKTTENIINLLKFTPNNIKKRMFDDSDGVPPHDRALRNMVDDLIEEDESFKYHKRVIEIIDLVED